MTSPTIDEDLVDVVASLLDQHPYADGQDLAPVVISAVLTHVLYGLYVAPRPDDGQPTIWRDGARPVPLMTRAAAPEMFAILAALLPDRTGEETDRG